MSPWHSIIGSYACMVAMCVLVLFIRSVQAEMYVAGQIGVHMPSDASHVTSGGPGPTVGGSDLALQNSLMYGAKLGYFLDQVKFEKFNLGLETEMFIATPHLKQQESTIGGSTGTLSGFTNRILTWAPVVVLVRYQAGSFEPYAGLGPGLFFSNLSSGGVFRYQHACRPEHPSRGSVSCDSEPLTVHGVEIQSRPHRTSQFRGRSTFPEL